MPNPRFRLPRAVYLRCQPSVPVAEAYEMLNMSRQRAHQLRCRWHMPGAVDGMIDTQRLAQWLTRFGCKVEWI